MSRVSPVTVQEKRDGGCDGGKEGGRQEGREEGTGAGGIGGKGRRK